MVAIMWIWEATGYVYLATGNNHHVRRASQIKALLSIPNDMHLIMGGDFNFAERRCDTTDFSDYHKLKKGADKHWRKLLHKHGLWEVTQDKHTQIALQQTTNRTSRIDRFYISHNEADAALITPQTQITNTPNSILNTISNAPHATANHISTHIALTLTFHPTDTPNKHQPYKLPPWIPRTLAFKQIFLKLWNDSPPDSNPFDTELRLKRTAKAAHKRFNTQNANRTTKTTDSLCDLHTSILRLKQLNNPKNTNTNPPTTNQTPLPLPQEMTTLRNRISQLLENGTPGPGITTHHRLDTDKSEGAALFRAKAASAQVTDKVRTTLPSTKKSLTSLRTKITDVPTTDPKKQAKIIKHYWGDIWSKRPGAPSRQTIDEYLSSYTKRIPFSARPTFPTLENVETYIKKTKNSAPGPDGIPFSFYRELIDTTAPVLLSFVIKMSLGTRPPKEFNYGGLCIFPKDGSSTVDRTRPITLNNTSNRIVAGVVADCIMPALDAIIETRQKGFIRGRRGEDNIIELTDTFYNKLNKQKQHYFLFIDTAKAFDSLDHDFLFAVLETIGLSSWVINIIRGLMTDVRVRPLLSGRIRTTIPINRGVKQGCPLSPLLFVIAYDPFLTRTGSLPGALVWSYADDAVLAHDSLDGIDAFTKMIDEFSLISGFGVNREKCSILHVLQATEPEIARLNTFDWQPPDPSVGRALKFTSQAVYLGILVGYDISTSDIFQEAYNRFTERSDIFSCALRYLPTHARIKIFNIHIIPLLSYITRFYILPHKELGNKLRNIMRRKIVSFNGSAHKFIHLSTPTKHFGPSTPLRDLWAANVSALASQFDFNSIQITNSKAVLPGKLYLNDDGPPWNGLLISDHIACAALEFVNDIIPKKDGQPDLTPLDMSKYKHPLKRLRKTLYALALTEYTDDINENLLYKLHHMNMSSHPTHSPPNTPSTNFTSHGKNISPNIPPHLRDHQRALIFNALPTDMRRRFSNPAPPRAPPPNTHPCYFCHTGPDHVKHIYGDCPPVKAARCIFGKRVGIHLKHTPNHYGLSCKHTPNPINPKPPPNLGPCGSGACLTFPYKTLNTPNLLAIAPLGKGTNNIGELYAIGLAIDMFLTHSTGGDTLHILSDSRITTLLIEHGARAHTNKALVQAVRCKYWAARSTRRIQIHWLPAHIGIRGNEDADALADEAARLSAQGQGYTPSQLRARILHRNFYGPSDKPHLPCRLTPNRPTPAAKRPREPATHNPQQTTTTNKRSKQTHIHSYLGPSTQPHPPADQHRKRPRQDQNPDRPPPTARPRLT